MPVLYPAATWRAGPPGKLGYGDPNRGRIGKGAVFHSSEGTLEGALAVLDDVNWADGGGWSSWHLTNPKSGPLLQHYGISRITWHAGYDANIRYVGVEDIGYAGEPLTDSQVTNLLGLTRWMAQEEEWAAIRRHDTLFEHNEFMATACPSGRIPWDRIIEGVGMADGTLARNQTLWLLKALELRVLEAQRMATSAQFAEITRDLCVSQGWELPEWLR